MAPSPFTLRIAEPGDAAELLAIYAPYVRRTAVTYEYEVPSLTDFAGRIRKTLERYPYLAAERDGALAGYAYAGPLHHRAAYAWSAEVSIYVRQDCRRGGLGRALYGALEELLSMQHIVNACACIACPEEEDEYLTRNSVGFHRRMGYHMVGEFHRCSYKFGRWYGMAWMEKHLGSHPDCPAPVIPFPDLGDAARQVCRRW